MNKLIATVLLAVAVPLSAMPAAQVTAAQRTETRDSVPQSLCRIASSAERPNSSAPSEPGKPELPPDMAPNAKSEPPKPLVIQNPDGTLTFQKPAADGDKKGKGLVIPPQVVIPIIPKQGNLSHSNGVI
jgi:hypothetical protein